MKFDISSIIKKQKEVSLNFSNIIETSQEIDKYGQVNRWGVFANPVGEYEIINCTFSRLGFDRYTKKKNYHAEVTNVTTEKK